MESQLVQDLWEFPRCESHLEPKPKPKDFLSCFSLWRNQQSPLPTYFLLPCLPSLPLILCALSSQAQLCLARCPNDRLHSAGWVSQAA